MSYYINGTNISSVFEPASGSNQILSNLKVNGSNLSNLYMTRNNSSGVAKGGISDQWSYGTTNIWHAGTDIGSLLVKRYFLNYRDRK